ncbi:hypothetical protein AYK24_09885 [Thermoplasmatales archaeon SG8-52-4]|nr:MAG: hypothetical protein AYK24_09885 [Thermoplasmatales archaeon SG8-52-4]
MLKKQENRKKTACFKPFSATIMVFLMIMLTVIPFVFSATQIFQDTENNYTYTGVITSPENTTDEDWSTRATSNRTKGIVYENFTINFIPTTATWQHRYQKESDASVSYNVGCFNHSSSAFITIFTTTGTGSAVTRNDTILVDCLNVSNLSIRTEFGEGVGAVGTGHYYEGMAILNFSEDRITLNSPVDNYQSLSNVSFNITSRSLTETLKNITLYINDTVNETIAISGVEDETIFNKTFALGSYNWSVYMCENNDSCYSSETRDLNISAISFNEEYWVNETIEGDSVLFTINVTTPFENQRISQGNLIYNSTSYAGTIVDLGNDNYTVSRTLTVPTVSADTNLSFYWQIILEDSSEQNSTTRNQTVNNLAIDDCSSYGVILMNLSLLDEDLQTLINGATYDTSVEVDIDIYPLGSISPIIEFYQNYSQDNNPQVCLENELGDSSYTMDVQIYYTGNSYSSEYYHIQSYSLINDTLGQNIDLLDLNSSNAQEFKIVFRDESFLAVEDALIQIQRKYVNEGEFKTVEIPITDSQGETTGSFRVSDTVYTIVVTRYGETLGTFSDMRPYCQNPTLEECIINLNSFATSIEPEDYTVGDDFAFTLSYNTTSRLISSSFTVPSGATSTVVLNTTLYDNIGDTVVCSDTLSSSSGTLSCTVPVTYTNNTIIVEVIKDGELQGHAIISLQVEPEDLYGASIVFLGLFLFFTVIGVGISDNPMLTGLFIIIGAILLIGMNLIDTGTSGFIGAGATFLWIVVVVVVVLVKGARRS